MCHFFSLAVLFSLSLPVLGEDPFIKNTERFTDATDDIFGDDLPANGVIAAFGDFDSDKMTDIFVLRENGHIMETYFQQVKTSVTLSKSIHKLSISRDNDTITSVVPGDFDGDSHMDLLITTKPDGRVFDMSVPTSAFVYWGDSQGYTFDSVTTVSDELQDQPLAMDYDGNMIPDIFDTDMKGVRRFWFCNDSDSRDFASIKLTGDYTPFRLPNSNAFLALTEKYTTDLLVTSTKAEDQSQSQFEVWRLPPGVPLTWEKTDVFDLPTGNFKHVGQSAFADMDADGRLDHLLPVCTDDACVNSYIYIRRGGQTTWTLLLDMKDNVVSLGERWGFVPPGVQVSNWAYIPISLRIGDINMDTFPDVVCILRAGTNSSAVRRVVVLENAEGRVLKAVWDSTALNNIKMPILATFMDLTHTGILDILVVSQAKPDQEPNIHVIKNNFNLDAYFLKAHVLSGLCFNDCPDIDTKPYGVNQPGPLIKYTTVSSLGTPQNGAAAQLSQSAYFSLQLPYVVFGLGQTPNYVDYLTVSIPTPTKLGSENVRQHTWASIIPNSELIAIPYPIHKPEEWRSVLLITPGTSVLVTGCVLIGTCVFMAIVVGSLQLLEKKEDDREKRQESHRFHFDAM